MDVVVSLYGRPDLRQSRQNCGSSSIKFKLFALPNLDVLLSGQASGVATKGSSPTIKLNVHHKEQGGQDEHITEEEDENMQCKEKARRVVDLKMTDDLIPFL